MQSATRNLAIGVRMTDAECIRFHNTAAAAIGRPDLHRPVHDAATARERIWHVLDELGELGLTATVGVEGCAEIAYLEHPVMLREPVTLSDYRAERGAK